MKQLLILMLILQLNNIANGQNTANNNLIPGSLYGEWYNIADGQLKLAVYNNMIIYQQDQWFLDSIESKNKNHYILKLKGGAHNKIQVDVKGEKATVSDGMNSKLVMTKNINLCKTKHNLSPIKGPVLENNFIWFDCFFEDTGAYQSKQQVTVSVYDYVSNKTAFIFQFVSKENSTRFQIPVNSPSILSISFSTGRKEQFYVLPGTQLIELITKERGSKYMSDAAPLIAEMQLIKKDTSIFPNPNQILFPLILQPDSIRAVDPARYKRLVQARKIKSNTTLDSLYVSKTISPLTYQIEKLNIKYAYANMLLNYNKIMASSLDHYKLPHEKVQLDLAYFDFLNDMDYELGPVAPEYASFVSNMRTNDPSEMFPFPKNTMNNIKKESQSIDALIYLLKPMPNKNELLSTTEQQLFDSINQLANNPKAKAAFLEKNKSAFEALLDNYSYLTGISALATAALDYYEDQFNCHPGTLTDLIIMGNMVNQTRDFAPIPSYFFKPESGYFANPFIASYLLKLSKESQKTENTESLEDQKNNWSTIDNEKVKTIDTIDRGGFELIFVNYAQDFSIDIKQKMIETFFKVYPKQLIQYNNTAPKHVSFIIDPEYKGVAATADSLTRYNPAWFKLHPNDIDVVTHEVMHIVQCYQNNNYQPRWIAEGIADYVRLKMGLYNDQSNWTLPEYSQNQHPQDSYRVTAKFFNWLEQHKKKNLVKDLDLAMRKNNYSETFWEKETHENLDQLWNDYAKFSTN